MQENRIDGTTKLTEGADLKAVDEALKDPRNRSITLHKKGSIIKMHDGTEYLVGLNGMLKKLCPKVRRMGHIKKTDSRKRHHGRK